MSTERIKIIKEKLDKLKKLDKGFSIFGSSRHKYQFNQSLSDKEISQIESENGITLSQEYREILKHLGNGGAGGGYGLESISLKNINPPYIGTQELLKNWNDPKNIDTDMVDIDEISGYIKLFDYGCGMETVLIVNGREKGALIFFDCDGRFEKIEKKTILDSYDTWLDQSIMLLERVERKLQELPLQEVIDSEWKLDNFFIKEMILSLIGAEPLEGSHSEGKVNAHLEQEYGKWKIRRDSLGNS